MPVFLTLVFLTLECVITFIAAAIAAVCYTRLSRPFKVLAWAIFVIFALTILSRVSSIKYKTNTFELQGICIAQYVLYASVYYFLFKSEVIKKIVIVSIILITVAFVVNGLFFEPFSKMFPTNIYAPSLLLLVVFSLLLFREMLLYPLKIKITRQSVFWFNTAIFFYSTTMFFNLGLSNYLSIHDLNDDFIFECWYFITYIFNILLCFAIISETRKNQLANT